MKDRPQTDMSTGGLSLKHKFNLSNCYFGFIIKVNVQRLANALRSGDVDGLGLTEAD